jgi:hypothetical protein
VVSKRIETGRRWLDPLRGASGRHPGGIGHYYSALRNRKKIREILFLILANAPARQCESFTGIFDDLQDMPIYLLALPKTSLKNSRVFELGYGRRPEEPLALTAQGIDTLGVDLYAPLLGLSPTPVLRPYIGTQLNRPHARWRYQLFEIEHRQQLSRELSRRGPACGWRASVFSYMIFLSSSCPNVNST